ncbi:hypothetical protein TDB9533_02755 [Thalassocella blandensis]|nr:hypothetical protein TDB9533_02755 [Thalassocella blandensis]
MENFDVKPPHANLDNPLTQDLAASLAYLKRNLMGRAQADIADTAADKKQVSNHFNVQSRQVRSTKSRENARQTLKMCFSNAANETFVVTKSFHKPINALRAFKTAKIAEKSYGKLNSFALYEHSKT